MINDFGIVIVFGFCFPFVHYGYYHRYLDIFLPNIN
jgi:hypothetical protein